MAKKKETTTTGDDILQQFGAATLVGDVRTFMLDRMKSQPKLWRLMTQEEQSDEINATQEAAENMVRKAVELAAAKGRKMITATLESIAVKDGIKAVIKLSKMDEQRHELMDAQGHTVMLAVADAEEFMGEKEPEEPEPNQPDLSFGEGGDEDPEAAAANEKVSNIR